MRTISQSNEKEWQSSNGRCNLGKIRFSNQIAAKDPKLPNENSRNGGLKKKKIATSIRRENHFTTVHQIIHLEFLIAKTTGKG